MITEQDLQRLVDFESEFPPVLSLYLNVDPTQQTVEEYKLTLRSLLKRASGRAAKEDVNRVERYIDFEYDWQGKGLALFSCVQREFWHPYSLPVPVPNQIAVSRRAYVKPLTDVLDEYGHYGVVLVDREGARLFLFHLGELVETAGTLGEDIKRHKQGGWAAQRYKRKADEQALQNLKAAAEFTAQFCESGRCNRLILGGPGDVVPQFYNLLPKALRDQVAGTISVGMAASETEVRDLSIAAIREAVRESDRKLVDQVITAARSKGGLGVIGLDDTLGALQEFRIHTLVLHEGFSAPGHRCSHCGYISAQALAKCPYCESEMFPVEDVVDTAVRRAIEAGMEVEIVRDSPELVEAGSIGATLRY